MLAVVGGSPDAAPFPASLWHSASSLAPLSSSFSATFPGRELTPFFPPLARPHAKSSRYSSYATGGRGVGGSSVRRTAEERAGAALGGRYMGTIAD